MQFIRDLGRQFDAVATVKGGALIFAPRGATTTPGGKALPSLTITRQQCSSVTWRRVAREKAYDGAEAQWHDQDAGARKTVVAGGSNRRRLKRIYPSELAATAAVQAETECLGRVSATIDVTMAYGDARTVPGARTELSGFRAHIDNAIWRINSVDHEHGTGGLRTRIALECSDSRSQRNTESQRN